MVICFAVTTSLRPCEMIESEADDKINDGGTGPPGASGRTELAPQEMRPNGSKLNACKKRSGPVNEGRELSSAWSDFRLVEFPDEG